MAELNPTSETPTAKPGNGPARKLDVESPSFETRTPDAPKATVGDAGPAGQAVASTSSANALSEIGDVWRDALTPLLTAQIEANRWFDQMWRQMTGTGAFPALRTGRPFASLGAASTLGLPAADLRETEGAYQLSVELPGMGRDDIDLKIERDAIRLCGQKAEAQEDSRADYRISERRFGRFERTFPIPQDVVRTAIEAKFADGLLKVVMPKRERAPREESARIEIR